MTDAMLNDTAALLEWRAANLGYEVPEADVLFVLAAAERAIELATTNRAAFFVSLVKGLHVSRVAAQEDVARLRWRAHRERGERSPFLQQQVSNLMERLSPRR